MKLRMEPGGLPVPRKLGISGTGYVTDGVANVDFRLDCGSVRETSVGGVGRVPPRAAHAAVAGLRLG